MSQFSTASRGGYFAAALLTLAAAAASASTPIERGIVADDAHGQVVIMAPDGGVAALDVTTGATRWASNEADLPLFEQAGRIAALRDVSERGVLAYAVLDADDGSVIASRFATLPAPARVLVDERLGERFEISLLPGNRVAWTYTSETVPGAFLDERVVGAATDESDAPAVQRIVLSGIVTIDVGGGEARISVDSKPGASMPRAALDTNDMPELGGQRFLSASAAHLVAAERAGTDTWRWSVHARGGPRLGEIVSPYGYLPFAVVDRTLVVATPLRFDRRGNTIDIAPVSVEAHDLATGQSRWRHPIRDTAYRGPVPH